MYYTIEVIWHDMLLQYYRRQKIDAFTWETLRTRREMGFEIVILPVD